MDVIKIADGALEAEVIAYGATLKSLKFNGTQLVAGYSSPGEYARGDNYFGATVGRTCNRTGRSNYIDGAEYLLELNERGVNHLHGGFGGLSRKEWRVAAAAADSVTLECLSPDGEDGYPGNLKVTAQYTLRGGALVIRHKAETDKPTWVALTNHSYFNLNGIGAGSVFGTEFTINAHEVSQYDANARVTGREPVRDAFGFEFGAPAPLDRAYDHNFYLLPGGRRGLVCGGKELGFAAEARGAVAGMSVYTDLPCLQFYTGGFIGEGTRLQEGAVIGQYGAFCFETQLEPGSPSRGEAVLRPGEVYDHTTVYLFDRTAKIG